MFHSKERVGGHSEDLRFFPFAHENCLHFKVAPVINDKKTSKAPCCDRSCVGYLCAKIFNVTYFKTLPKAQWTRGMLNQVTPRILGFRILVLRKISHQTYDRQSWDHATVVVSYMPKVPKIIACNLVIS